MKTTVKLATFFILFCIYSCSTGSQFIIQQNTSDFEYIKSSYVDDLIKIDYKILGQEYHYVTLTVISEDNENVEILYYDGDINLVRGNKDASIIWNSKFEKLPKGTWYVHLSISDTVPKGRKDEIKYKYEKKRDKSIAVEKLPTPLRPIKPAYPKKLIYPRITGVLVVQAYIGKNGIASKAYIRQKLIGVSPEINTLIEEKNIAAIEETRYKPAMLNGKPIGIWLIIPLYYK